MQTLTTKLDNSSILRDAREAAEMAALLLDGGAELAAQDGEGRTPLHLAVIPLPRFGMTSLKKLVQSSIRSTSVTSSEMWMRVFLGGTYRMYRTP